METNKLDNFKVSVLCAVDVATSFNKFLFFVFMFFYEFYLFISFYFYFCLVGGGLFTDT